GTPGGHRAVRAPGPAISTHTAADRQGDARPPVRLEGLAIQVPEPAMGHRKRLGPFARPTRIRALTASRRRFRAARWPARDRAGNGTHAPRSAGACGTSRPGTGPRTGHGGSSTPTAGISTPW